MSLKWIFNFFFLFLHLLLTSTWHMWIREALLENIWLDWRDGEGRIFLWRQPAVDLTSGESLVQSSPEHIHSVMPQRTALVWLVYNSSAYSEDPFQLHISNSDAIAMVIFMSRRFSGVRNRCSRSLPFTTLWIRGSRPASRPALHRALLTFPISPPHLRLIPSGGSGCRAGDPGFAKHGCGVQPGCSELPEGLGFLPGIVQNQCRRCDGGGGGVRVFSPGNYCISRTDTWSARSGGGGAGPAPIGRLRPPSRSALISAAYFDSSVHQLPPSVSHRHRHPTVSRWPGNTFIPKYRHPGVVRIRSIEYKFDDISLQFE